MYNKTFPQKNFDRERKKNKPSSVARFPALLQRRYVTPPQKKKYIKLMKMYDAKLRTLYKKSLLQDK